MNCKCNFFYYNEKFGLPTLTHLQPSRSPARQSPHLNYSAVPSRGFDLGLDDVRRPVCQPVVDGDHEGVFEELGQEEQREQEQPGGGQVGTAGVPGDGGALTHHLRQVVVVIALHRFL